MSARIEGNDPQLENNKGRAVGTGQISSHRNMRALWVPDGINNMKVTQAFEGNFIQALHLIDGDASMTIKSVDDPNTVKAADKKLIDKPIVRFEETDKGFILNKTNARAIGLAYGNEMTGWTGKKITIYATTCESFGEKNVPCVRVRPLNRFKGGSK